MIFEVRPARRTQGNLVGADRSSPVLESVMKASVKMTGLMLRGNPSHDLASQVLEYLRRCADVPYWFLEVLRPWRGDAERVLDLIVFEAAVVGHNWATHSQYQSNHIDVVA